MSKELIHTFLRTFTVLIITIAATFTSFADSSIEEEKAVLSNYSYSDGYLKLEGFSSLDIIKVLIKKDSTENWYDAEIADGHFKKDILLNGGNGTYDAYIMLHKGNYNFDYGPHISLEVKGEESEYIENRYETANKEDYQTNSIQDSNYYILAKRITQNSNSDYKKAQSIYKWVSKNVRYDRVKYRHQLNNDFSDEYGASVALRTGKGVCYDYAALATELGKAIGLKIKMAKGDYILKDGTALYHAWNEVYIQEQARWISMDTTFASVYGRDYFDTSDFKSLYFKKEEEL